MNFKHRLVVLHLVGVLKEGAHHPGMGQDNIDPFHGLFWRHGFASGMVGAARAATATPARGPAGFCLLDSASSLENSTSAAPTPTRTMPAHSFQPGKSKPKWNGWPFSGCQNMLTIVLMIGANPKMSGAMKSLYGLGSSP